MDDTARDELLEILGQLLELTPRLRSDALSAITLSPVDRLALWERVESLEDRAKQIMPPDAD